MANYEANSNKHHEEETKHDVKKVEGKVILRKKSPGKKFLETFGAEDASNIKSYILDDVIIPNLKALFEDSIQGALGMFLWGNSPRTSTKTGQTNYTKYSAFKQPKISQLQANQRRLRNGKHFDDIVVDDRGQAEFIVNEMYRICDKYGSVSIADLYEILNDDEHQANYTDNKYGWTDLGGTTYRRVRGGYLIDLPRAIPLD